MRMGLPIRLSYYEYEETRLYPQIKLIIKCKSIGNKLWMGLPVRLSYEQTRPYLGIKAKGLNKSKSINTNKEYLGFVNVRLSYYTDVYHPEELSII